MKTILGFLTAVGIASVSMVSAQQTATTLPPATAAAVKAQTDVLEDANASDQAKEAAVAAIAALASANPSLAPMITSAALSNLGGESANPTIVSQLMTTIVSTFANQPAVMTAIVNQASSVAPTLVSNIMTAINVSGGPGGGGDPLGPPGGGDLGGAGSGGGSGSGDNSGGAGFIQNQGGTGGTGGTDTGTDVESPVS